MNKIWKIACLVLAFLIITVGVVGVVNAYNPCYAVPPYEPKSSADGFANTGGIGLQQQKADWGAHPSGGVIRNDALAVVATYPGVGDGWAEAKSTATINYKIPSSGLYDISAEIWYRGIISQVVPGTYGAGGSRVKVDLLLTIYDPTGSKLDEDKVTVYDEICTKGSWPINKYIGGDNKEEVLRINSIKLNRGREYKISAGIYIYSHATSLGICSADAGANFFREDLNSFVKVEKIITTYNGHSPNIGLDYSPAEVNAYKAGEKIDLKLTYKNIGQTTVENPGYYFDYKPLGYDEELAPGDSRTFFVEVETPPASSTINKKAKIAGSYVCTDYEKEFPIDIKVKCDGTDICCGIYPNCENCNNKDKWYNKGSSYSCCDGDKKCSCQDQEYWDYYCSGTSCTHKVTSARTVKSNCVTCNDNNPCTADGCSGGACTYTPYCSGTDTDCGCTVCENCNNNDNWYDKGSSYSCCDGDKKCTCQDQEYWDYYCSGSSCTYAITDTRTVKSNCTDCGCTSNNTLKRCYDGFCSDSGVCNSTICNADAPCDGKKPGEDCGTDSKCNSTCKCVKITEYGVDLTAVVLEKNTTPNVNATYILTVKNTGTIMDSYALSINNIDNVAVASLNRTSVTLTSGSSATVLLNVTDETPETYNVSVTATSQGDASVSDTVMTKTKVTLEEILAVKVIFPPGKSGTQGETLTYNLNVKNTGTVQDTYNLQATSPHSWNVQITDNPITVNPSQTKDVQVDITIPSDAKNGTTDVLTLKAISQTNGSVFDENSTITTVTGIFPPIASKWQDAWHDTDGNAFNYRRPVEISGHEKDLADYQVRVVVDYDSDMQADYSDLRFVDTDSTNYWQLHYWIENYTESNATVWVKIPSLTAHTTKTIYGYYGNTDVSTVSDSECVFLPPGGEVTAVYTSWTDSPDAMYIWNKSVAKSESKVGELSGVYSDYTTPWCTGWGCCDSSEYNRISLSRDSDEPGVLYKIHGTGGISGGSWWYHADINLTGNWVVRSFEGSMGNTDEGAFYQIADDGKSVHVHGGLAYGGCVCSDCGRNKYDITIARAKFASPEPSTSVGAEESAGDTTPPLSITNLTNITGQTGINWTWTNPPDADFNHTVVYLNGTWQTNTSNPYYNATGLIQNTYYEIGTHTVDKVGNVNETLVNQTAKTTAEDTTPPSAVTDLATTDPASNTVNLTWTAPGDDGNTGTATTYDIRYLEGTPITESNWASATQCAGEPSPKTSSSAETFVVTGLSPDTTYYFALKTADEVPNWSPISNSPGGTTKGAAIVATREISPQQVMNGSTFTVTVTMIANQDIYAPILNETPPTGWSVTSVQNDGATFKESEIKWLWTESLPKGNSRTVIYNVTVPSDTTPEDYMIKGNVSAYEVKPITVGGDNTITVITDWNHWDDDGTIIDGTIIDGEIQEVVYCWLTDTTKNGHLVVDEEIQALVFMWLTG